MRFHRPGHAARAGIGAGSTATSTAPATAPVIEATGLERDYDLGGEVVHALRGVVVTHEPDVAERALRRVTIRDGRVESDAPTARALGGRP